MSRFRFDSRIIRLDVQSNSEIRRHFASVQTIEVSFRYSSLSARLIFRHFPSVYKIAILTAKTTFQSSIRETQMRKTKLFLENFFMHVFSCFVRTLACVAGGIRGHERMGSLKYRLPKNDTF
jgi:hypothetical protein